MRRDLYRGHFTGGTVRYNPYKKEYTKYKCKPIPFCIECGKRTCCEAYDCRPRNKNKSLGKQKFSYGRHLKKYQAKRLKCYCEDNCM